MSDKHAEVDVWYVDLEQIAVDLKQYEDLLDDQERAAAQKFSFQDLRDHYVIVHGLVRRVLADYLSVRPKQLKISRSEFGKPYLVDFPDLGFNISHSSADLLIAVASDVSLGVDIERIRPRQNLSGIVGRCFSMQEQQYWHALPEHEQLDAFFKLWTRKEAFVKAVGRGIALGLEQCELDLIRQNYFWSVPEQCGSAAEWRVVDIEVGRQSCAAVVVRASSLEVKLRDFLAFTRCSCIYA